MLNIMLNILFAHPVIASTYFILCLILGIAGRDRSMGFWGYFFGSLILTPIIGLLLVLVSAKRTPETRSENP